MKAGDIHTIRMYMYSCAAGFHINYASILNKISIIFSPHVTSPAGECLWQWYCTICGSGSSLARPTPPDLHTESRAEYGKHSVPTDTQ